jgi:TP901 family phage tail tape measure protein
VTILVGALRAELSAASASFEAAMTRSAASVATNMRAINRSARQLESIGSGLQSLGTSLSLAFTAPLLGIAAQSTRTFAGFEAGMIKVGAITGATGKTFESLEAQAKELGSTTIFTASQAAEGMGFLAMAGFEATEVMKAMPGVLQLAAAASMDLGRAADITSNVLTGYGIQVEELGRVNDVLVKAFTSSNTNLEQLGQAFKYAGPVASSAGIAFEEAAAALGMMGSAGIQADMAGTSLRGAIVRLLNPTKQMSELMEQLGLDVLDSTGNLKPLHEVFRQLEASGASTAEMMALFGQRAGPAMISLVDQGSAALQDFTREMENAEGSAARLEAATTAGLQGAFVKLSSAAEGLSNEVGATLAPAMSAAAAGLRSAIAVVQDAVLPAFRSLPVAAQVAAGGFALLAAAAGPVALGLGFLVSGLGQLVLVMGRLGITAQLVGSFRTLQAAAFALGNTTSALSLRLAFLQGQTAAAGVATGAYTVATGLLATAKGFLGGVLTAVSARLGLTTVATGVQTVATKALTLATGAASIAARGLAISIGFIGPAALAAGAAFAGWKVGKWIGEVTGLEDALSGMIARMMGASEEAIEFERAHNSARRHAERLGISVEEASSRVGVLKGQFTSAAGSAKDLDQAMEELAAAGELDTVAMRRLGAQAKALKDEGVELSAGLNNIVDWFEQTQNAGKDLGDELGSTGTKVETLATKFSSLISRSNTARLRQEWELTTGSLKDFQASVDELGAGGQAGLFGPEVLPQIHEVGAQVRTTAVDFDAWGERALAAGTPLESVVDTLRSMQAPQEVINRLTERYGEGAEDAADKTVDWSRHLEDIANLATSMGGTFGGIFGTLASGIAGIGASVDKINLGGGKGLLGGIKGFFSGGIGSVLGNFSAVGQMMPIAMGIGKAIGSLFGSSPVERAAEDAGKALGVTVSDALAEQIAEDAERLGDGVAAALVNLPEAIEEAGGIAEFGFDNAVSSARDLFSQIETGKLSVREAGEVFDEVFSELIPEAIDGATGLASASFLELIALNERFGTESAAVADFLGGQLQQTIGGLKDYVDNATVTTQAGADGLAGAVVAAFDQLISMGVPASEAVEQLGPIIEQLRAQFETAGLDGTAAFAALTAQVAIEAVLGLGQTLVGLHNMGLLNQETFAGLAAEASATFASLVEQGKGTPEALGAMQPALQQIWQLQQDFGYEVDEATQGLLDEAEAAGVVGDAHRDANDRAATAMERTAEILESIAEHMGVTLPDAARRGAEGIESAFRGIDIPPVDVRYNHNGRDGQFDGTDTGGAGYARGGARDFGPRSIEALHGREVIAPVDEESAIVDELAQRITSRMGGAASAVRGGAAPGSSHVLQLVLAGRPVGEAILEMSEDGSLRIHQGAVVGG